MAFDECPDLDGTPEQLRGSIERTIRWLQRSVDALERHTVAGLEATSSKRYSASFKVALTATCGIQRRADPRL